MLYIPKFETQTDQRVPVPWTNCTFAAGAMLIDWWTYGQIDTSDVALRDASGVPTNLGANFAALRRAILALLRYDLRYSEWDGSGNAQMTWRQLRDHLAKDGAAVIAGSYAKLAGHRTTTGLAINRWQPGGDFGHAVTVCDYRPEDQTLLWLDPLARGSTYTGDRIKIDALWAFIYRSGSADANVRVAAAHGFAGTRPAPPKDVATDWAGKITAFGTKYPTYVHSDADALAWVNRNIRRAIAGGTVWKWG